MRRQLLGLLLFSTASLAQVTVEGEVVLKTTGQPLPGVGVSLTCPDLHSTTPGVHTAMTDVTGHFRFPGLPASLLPCGLSLDGPRLLPRHHWVPVQPQETRTSVRVAMRPQSAIAGKVLGEKGWPLAGTNLTVAQYRTAGGVRELQAVASGRADDRGEYRIGKLVPGRYYLYVRPPGPLPGGDYLPTWYAAAVAKEASPIDPKDASPIDVTDASPIDLKEGEELSGIDLHLARGGGVDVRGRVTLPGGFQPAQACLRISWEIFRITNGGSVIPVGPDGSFMLRHVAPGTYMLTVTPSGPVDHSLMPGYLAARTVTVSRDNIDGIALNVVETPVRALTGKIVVEGGGPPDQAQIADRVHIGLMRLLYRFSAQAKVEPDGSFVIPGVWPGRYTLNASALGAQVTSVKFGGQEILNRVLCGGLQRCGEFDFDGTPAPLQVTVTKTGRVSGTITDAGAHPVFGAGLILVPAGGEYEPYLGNLVQAQTDEHGAFTAVPILPGVYRVYVAGEGVDAGQTMADPVFLKAFAPLTVVAGENTPLKLILPSN